MRLLFYFHGRLNTWIASIPRDEVHNLIFGFSYLGVFITESLKRAVGNEPIKLLVSIDEEDYEEGRNVLLGNVYADHDKEDVLLSTRQDQYYWLSLYMLFIFSKNFEVLVKFLNKEA